VEKELKSCMGVLWPFIRVENFGDQSLVQWTLDLRKILGVTKIFLKSRFFLISNTRKTLEKA
jgi:hypothetical protein